MGSESLDFGLVPSFQAAYNGTGSHDYDLDGDGSTETREVGNCHMGGGSKHDAPFHPVGLGPEDSGNCFFDDDRQIGPTVRSSHSRPAYP